ncbi:MAG: DUF5615 family PIN-like protein [Candidatus Hydrogenedentes bacterium]|nr:DUF5615 family PIN-like protein [Candidatus Hydrogenedentota bacterium]
MDLKLDENLPIEAAVLLRSEFHDVMTVGQEGLSGAIDSDILRVCAAEGRTLFACDRDFENTKRYPSTESVGIVVLRVGPGKESVLATIRGILPFFYEANIQGQTWIVGETSLRIR